MRNLYSVVTITTLFISTFFSTSLSAQSKFDPSLLAPSIDTLYFVVVGAFVNPRYATAYAESVKRKNGLNTHNEFNVYRKLYYIYILETPDRSNAFSLAVKLQNERAYSETWVHKVYRDDLTKLGKGMDKSALGAGTGTEKNALDAETKNAGDTVAVVDPVDGSKQFIFKLRSISTGNEVAGDVDIFDADIIKGRKIESYRGNDVVNVKPINKSGNIIVVCDVFGYRRVQIPINFNDIKNEDAVSIKDGKVVVNFDLVRLKKGDKVIMYNLYFFNDAALMRPESRYEVNALLEYLKEKPTSKIKIHGHTNGNDHGPIITLGDSKNYYGLTPDNKQGRGSALKLSEERAKIIQSYLVDEGIDINRMELKAWGGKVPIYDEDHSLAHANVRVEIEILEE
jgi:outer membrane protein OmpA-like peptidoglycan-associated protein